MGLAVRTPFGRPVAWADVRLTGSGGGNLGCVVVACRRLGHAASAPLDDFILCLVAHGAGESTAELGWRASQLALAAFLGSFLASDEVDVLWRLRDAVKASDARLVAALDDRRTSSSLTAVFVAFDGAAYGVSVGDSSLVVVPARSEPGFAAGVKKLGRERSTALGTGETLLDDFRVGFIEEWWPTLADGRMRLEPGTSLFVDGGLGDLTADGRSSGTEPGGGSGAVVRFTGRQVSTSRLVAHGGWLVSVSGMHAGASTSLAETFGVCCLAETSAHGLVAGFLQAVLEDESAVFCSAGGLEQSFTAAGGDSERSRLAVVVCEAGGAGATFASGGASAEAAIAPLGSSEAETERRRFTLRLGPDSDPLDRGILVAFEQDDAARLALGTGAPGWMRSVARLWRRWRRD